MIPNNYLEDRLNSIKKGEKPITPENADNLIMDMLKDNIETKQNLSFWQELLIKIFNTLSILGASTLYGFAIKGIFNLDWILLTTMGVGFSFNALITFIKNAIFK